MQPYRLESFSLPAMNVASPSRPHPLVPATREKEDELTRIIAELDIELQTAHDNKEFREALELLMRNTPEFTEFSAERAFAQKLAVGGGGEPDPAPR
jgi:hypothetical protein